MKTILFLFTLLVLTFNTHAASVTLAHDPNTDGVTKGYFIYTFQNWVQVFKTDVGLGTTNTVANLTNLITYTFYVTAYDINKKESLPSNTITNTIPALPIPAVPIISSVTSVKNGPNWNVTANWGTVSGATTYSVQLFNASGAVLFTNTSVSNTSTFMSISAGQYSIIVKSINSSGASLARIPYLIININAPINVKGITISPQ